MNRVPLPFFPPVACLLACASAGVLPSVARAEDFSGFYAGINAGYGWSRERKPAGNGTALGIPPAAFDRAGPDLPPSAATAAAAMRRGTPKSEAR